MPQHSSAARRAPSVHYAIVAVVFLAVGLAAATALNRAGAEPAATESATASTVTDVSADASVGQPAVNERIAAPPGPPDTPETAVAQFLAAEQRGDFGASYELLTAENQKAIGTPAQWVAAHADLPQVTGWQLDDVQGDDATAVVIGTVGFRPTLNEVAGLIPGSAAATWHVVAADDLWLVDFDNSDLLPRYPADTAAAGAVREWVAAAQRCEPGPQYDGGLLGPRTLVDSLCDAEGETQVDGARSLNTQELDVLLPPFGADAEVWARAVDVAAPVPLRALVAPRGEDWIVVGVLPPA